MSKTKAVSVSINNQLLPQFEGPLTIVGGTANVFDLVNINSSGKYGTGAASSGSYTHLEYLSLLGPSVPILPSINDKYINKIYSQNYFEVLVTFNTNIANIDNSYINLYKCSTLISTSPNALGVNIADRIGLQVIKKSNTQFLILIPPSSINSGGYYIIINHPLFNNNYIYIFFRTELDPLSNYSCYRESAINPLSPTPTPTTTPTLTVTTSVTPTPTITPSITTSVTQTPSVTPTVTPTISVTPSITPTITPSYSPTQTTCVYDTQNKNSYYSPIVPSPTPSLSQNIPSSTFSSNIILSNLIPNNRYVVNLSIENPYGPYTIMPNDISFVANSSGQQTISILLTKLNINKKTKLNITINDLDSLKSKTINKFFTDNIICSCDIRVSEDNITIYRANISSNISDSNFRSTANYGSYGAWGSYNNGYVTTVGTNGSSSYYGTYDQSGNVWEWIENGIDTKRFLCGGSWKSNFFELDSTSSKSKIIDMYNRISDDYGFRVGTYTHPNSLNVNDPGYYVAIGNKCNIDYKGVGNVRYDYMIGKYPVTVIEYVRFLNAIAKHPKIVSLLDLYPFDHNMSAINKIYDTNSQTYSFTSKDGLEQKPITLVSHTNAQRYINWLSGGMTDYLIPTSTTDISSIINMLDFGLSYQISPLVHHRKHSSAYFLPNLDEWYKAAYYNDGYKLYVKYSMYYSDSSLISFNDLNKAPLHVIPDSSGNGPNPKENEI